MRGKPLTDGDYGQLKADALPPITDLVGAPRKPKSTVPPKRRQQYIDDAAKRARDGDWKGARAGDVLGLYCHLHRIVYGAWPEELDGGKEWRSAMMRVATFMKNEFGDDPAALADFVAWTWRREEARDKQRQARGEERRRLVWRWQFCRSLVTDYKVAGQRKVG